MNETIKINLPAWKKALFEEMAEDAEKSLNQFVIDCLDAEAEKLSITAIIKEERQE